MPYFQTFCCCCSLRSGAFIIGILSLTLSVLGFTGVILADQSDETRPLSLSSLMSFEYGNTAKHSLTIVGFLILMFTSALLLMGTIKRSSQMLWGWVVAFSGGLIAWTINSVSNMWRHSGILRSTETHLFILVIVTIFSIYALWIYSVMIVHSYYKQLKRIEREETDSSEEFRVSAKSYI